MKWTLVDARATWLILKVLRDFSIPSYRNSRKYKVLGPWRIFSNYLNGFWGIV